MKGTRVRATALLMALVMMAALCVPAAAAEPPAGELPPTGDESSSVPEEDTPAPEEPEEEEPAPEEEAPPPEEEAPAEEPPEEETQPEDGEEEPEAIQLPQGFEVGPEVYAEAETPDPTVQDDVFSAAGFNLSTLPEGQGERKDMKPYGDAHTLTINEMLVFGSNEEGRTGTYGYLEANLYGHDALASKDVMESEKKSVQLMDSTGAAPDFFDDRGNMAAMEGDFAGEGIKYQVAVLAAEASADTNGNVSVSGFELYVMNGADVARGTANSLHRIASFDYGKNESRSLTTSAAQGELFVETGDLDGDGRDEIIFLLPDPDNAKVNPARLLVYSNTGTAGGWKSAANWEEVLNMPVTGVPMHSVKESGYYLSFANHSLAVGDLDGDGKAEVAVTGSTLYANSETDDNDAATMQLQLLSGFDFSKRQPDTIRTYNYNSAGTTGSPLFGSGGLGLSAPPTPGELGLNTTSYVSGAVTYHPAKVLPAQLGVAIGDVDGGVPELLVGYTLYGTIKKTSSPILNIKETAASTGMGYTVEQLRLNGDELERVSIGGQPVLRVDMGDIAEATNAASPGNYPWYLGIQVKTPGDTFSIINSTNDPGGSNAIYSNEMAMRLTAAQLNGPQALASIIVGGNRHDRSFGASTDPYTFYDTGTAQYNYYPLSDGNHAGTNQIRIYTLRPAVMTSIDGEGNPIPAYGYVIGQRSTGISLIYGSYVEFISGGATSNVSIEGWNTPVSQRLMAGKLRHIGSVTVAMPDTDRDSVTLDYQNYSFMYTDPTVIAALAAPPYYRDIANVHGVDYTSESSTSYSMELGTGSGTTEGQTTNLGAYVSVEAEVGTPSVRAVVESEVNYNKQWSTQFSSMLEKSRTRTFESKGQDSVVLLAYPTDVFTYSMTFPVNDVDPDSPATYADREAGDDFATCDYSVVIPYSPTYSVLSLREYNRVYRQYTDLLPNIGEEVFTHTEGWPGSYPTGSSGFYGAEVAPDPWYSSGTSPGASMEDSLTISSSSESTTTSANSVSFKAGGGVSAGYSGLFIQTSVKVTAGVTYGSEENHGKVVSNSEGVTYSGKVGGIPEKVDGNDYGFAWKMMQYQYRGKQNFPVVTYLVQGDRNPVRLPEVFEVSDASTSDKVTLRWLPSPDDQNPGEDSAINYMVYQVVENAQNAMPRDDAPRTYNAEDGYYYCTVPVSQPGQWYNFVLAAKPQSRLKYSIFSESIGVMTFPTGSSGGFAQQPENLVLRPGRSSGALTAKLNVSGSTSMLGAWQRWDDATDSWHTLTRDSYPGTALSESKGNYELKFTQPAAYHAGTYRLLVMVGFSGVQGMKEFISNTVEVGYSRWDASMTVSDADGQQIPDVVTDSALVLHVGLADAESSGLAFGGYLQYTLTLPTGSQSIGQVVYPPSGGGKAVISLGTTVQGGYTLQLAYIGDPNYEKVTSELLSFTRVNRTNSNFITATTPTGRVQYGMPSSLAVQRYHNANPPAAVTDGTEFTLYRYTGAGALELAAPSTYSLGAGNSSITVTALGRYQLAVFYPEATNTIKRDFEVVPLPLNYRISSLILDVGDALEGLEIKLQNPPDGVEALLGNDLYKNADLQVYAEDGSPAQNPTGTAGRYIIRVNSSREEAVGAKPQYNIQVTTGVLNVQLNLKTVTYGTLEGTAARGGVKLGDETDPQAMASGEVAKDGTAKLTAVPANGYQLDHWMVSVNGGSFIRQEKSSSTPMVYTISGIRHDHTVLAVFTHVDKPNEGTSLAVYPAAAQLTVSGENAATQQFTAVLDGVAGGVDWTVDYPDGSACASATIGKATGLLTVPAGEAGNTLRVTATSQTDPRLKGQAKVEVTQGEVAADTVLGVKILSSAAYLERGETLELKALAQVQGARSTAVTWKLHPATPDEAEPEGVSLTAGGILTATANAETGVWFIARASSEADSSKSADLKLVVAPAGGTNETAGKITLAARHLVLAAGEQNAVSLPFELGKSAMAKELRVRVAEGSKGENVWLKASLTPTRDRLALSAAADAVGCSYVVRVVTYQNTYDECRVDVVASGAPSPETMEPRAVAASVTANVRSTADIILPLNRVMGDDTQKDLWSLMDGYTVRLKETNSTKLLNAFEPQLEIVDDSRLRLVPTSTEALEGLSGSYRKVMLVLLDENGDEVKDSAGQSPLRSSFTLKISKTMPSLKAAALALDTWSGSDSDRLSFTGGRVLAVEYKLSTAQKKWIAPSEAGFRLTAPENKSGSMKLTVKATVEGWTKPVTVKVSVKATKTAPPVKLKSATAKLYQVSSASGGTTLQLAPGNKNIPLSSLNIDYVSVRDDKAAKYSVSPLTADYSFTLSATEENETVVSEDVWLLIHFRPGTKNADKPHAVKVKVSAQKAALKLKAARSSVTLNAEASESYSLPIALNHADVDIADLHLAVTLQGANKAGISIPEWDGAGVLDIKTTPEAANATNKYTLELFDKDPAGAETATRLHKMTLSVKVVHKTPKVSLSAKGKLDVSLARPTPVRVTAKFSSYLGGFAGYTSNNGARFVIQRKEGRKWGAEVYDQREANPVVESGANFTITEVSPTVWELSLAGGFTLEPGSYRIGLVKGQTDSGQPAHPYEDSTPYAGFTVTASRPKVSLQPASVGLVRGDRYSQQAVSLAVPQGYQAIEKVRLKTANKSFYVSPLTADGQVIISFADDYETGRQRVTVSPYLKAKGTTLTLEVLLAGRDGSKYTTTVRVPVKVS